MIDEAHLVIDEAHLVIDEAHLVIDEAHLVIDEAHLVIDEAHLVIDEAHLLRLDVFAQLHTLAQVDFDSRNLLPIVLSGQTALIDKLL